MTYRETLRLWTFVIVFIGGIIIAWKMDTHRACNAAFAWAPFVSDSAWIILIHPECGVGIPAPAVKP